MSELSKGRFVTTRYVSVRCSIRSSPVSGAYIHLWQTYRQVHFRSLFHARHCVIPSRKFYILGMLVLAPTYIFPKAGNAVNSISILDRRETCYSRCISLAMENYRPPVAAATIRVYEWTVPNRIVCILCAIDATVVESEERKGRRDPSPSQAIVYRKT